jgi:hypothetical protein
MKLHHDTPCAECPWRKEAPAGWLGGHPPEYYADAVRDGEVPACHLRDFGPEDDRTAFCAGALACMKNGAVLPAERWPGQKGARAARQKVRNVEGAFMTYAHFYAHHTGGKRYEAPWLRKAETR